MIDGNPQEFVDTLYLGEEVIFEFHQQRLFAQGYNLSKNEAVFRIDRWRPEPLETVYESHGTSVSKCVERFLEEKFFDGRSFWEVEKEITWCDS